MNKQTYKSPEIHLDCLQMEECLVSSSTDTYYATPAEDGVSIGSYETIQEGNKDLNINF